MKLLNTVLNDLFIAQRSWKVQLMQNWDTIVGTLHTRIRLEKIVDDATLIVGVHDVHWMQELYYLSHELIATINTALGKSWVKNIKFVMSSKLRLYQPYRRKIKAVLVQSAKKTPPRKMLQPEHMRALQKIADPELKQALTNLFHISL